MNQIVEGAVVAVDFITPLLVVILGWYVRQLERKLKLVEHAEQKVMDWRLSVYQDVTPLLNDIYCFVTYRGNWKKLTPVQILEAKRAADKRLSIYSPYLSESFQVIYQGYIEACFKTYAGKGMDAQVRCGSESHKEYGDYEWKVEWNELFVGDSCDKVAKGEVERRYGFLLKSFAAELGLASTH